MKKLLFTLLVIASPLGFIISYGQGVSGNGNVVEKTRSIENFSGVSVKGGIDLYLTQGDENILILKTDENLQDHIITEVIDNSLKIYPKSNIKNAKEITVFLTFIELSAILAKEGSDVETTSTIDVEDLAVKCEEGSDLKLLIETKNLALKLNEGSDATIKGSANNVAIKASEGSDLSLEATCETIACKINEGSDVYLKGSCQSLTISATEGSDVDASGMECENCSIVANEGSDAQVYVTHSLTVIAKESSDISYKGNPEIKQIQAGEDCTISSQ